MNPTPEPAHSPGPTDDEAPSFDPAMVAATEDEHPNQERNPERTPPWPSSTTDDSAQDVEKMYAARRKAREQGLRRAAGSAGEGRPGPTNAWAKQPSAAAGSSPYVDPRLAQAEAAGTPPPWLGTRWREIPPEMQRQAWIGLRRWVDWLINEFRLQEEVVPACWFMHPNLVQELYAAMCMEQKAWEEAAASLTPMMMWHPNLHAMIMRLREMVSNLGSCSKGKHRPVEHLERDYDEDQWRRVAYGRREEAAVARPGAGEEGYLVRARIIGPSGVELGVSESVVGISPVRGSSPATVELRRDATTAAKDSVIHLHAEAVAEAEKVVWEKAESWTADETTGQIIAAEWTPYDQSDQSGQEP